MQTYAEAALIQTLIKELKKKKQSQVLSIGSGGSVVIEEALDIAGCDFVVDHLDIESRKTKQKRVRKQIVASAEDMRSIKSGTYDACFSNFVWEHIPDVVAATQETARVLKSGGVFVMTVPNPRAPEFLFARLVPLALREKIKHHEAFPTYYGYKSISRLVRLCRDSGFSSVELKMYPAVYTYLHHYSLLSALGKLYDTVVRILHLHFLMGHALFICKK